MRDDEALEDFNRQKGFTIPIMSESEMVVNREIERVERLRRLADRVQERVREKVKELERLQTKVVARDQHDESLAADIVAGDCTIEVLEARANAMSGSLEEARALGEGYEMLIELLKSCPPFTDKHVKTQEQNLQLAKQQLADLMHHRHNMYLESERIEAVRKRQITDKIMYYRDVRRELREKIKKFYNDSMKNQKPIPPLAKGAVLAKYLKALAKKSRLERRRASRSLQRDSIEGSTMSSPLASKPVSPPGSVVHPLVAGKGKSPLSPPKMLKKTASMKDMNDSYSVISFVSQSDDSDNEMEKEDVSEVDGDDGKMSPYALMFGKYLTRNTNFSKEVRVHSTYHTYIMRSYVWNFSYHRSFLKWPLFFNPNHILACWYGHTHATPRRENRENQCPFSCRVFVNGV
jgi:hypothetical protein